MESTRYQTVVRRQHVRRREIIVVLAILAMAAVLVSGFLLGRHASYTGMGIDPQKYRDMEAALPELEGRLDAAQAALDIELTRSEVDRVSLELVRAEMAEQKEQVAMLREGLNFYRSLMAPEDLDQGVSLRPPELVKTDAGERYSFRIVAQQEARTHKLLKGDLSAEVFGLVGEEEVIYSLADLSEDVTKHQIELRFRYFQAVQGELILPEGFTPQGIRVEAAIRSPRKIRVQEQYSWQVQKRFTHVGK